MESFSISPSGEKFPIPVDKDYAEEYARLVHLTRQSREAGQEIVVVMGVGFVGAVMAAIVADTVDKKTGQPSKFVIGCQRPSTRSYWKIPLLNRGQSPVKAEDPEVDPMIARCVLEKKTLTATYNPDCLALADCVVVDVQCDYTKHDLGNMRTGEAEMAALEATMRTIGEKIRRECLVLIETTVAPGTTEFVAWPILKKAFRARGIDDRAAAGAQLRARHAGPGIRGEHPRFLAGLLRLQRRGREAASRSSSREVLNTEKFPLTVMDRPIESETTKIVENSYRATILAFLNEWSLFAERNGVDLIKVIKAIKMRPTHSNIIFPGPGIGGYCLPKDGGLGYWAYKHILGFEDGDSIFKITPTAIDINDTRGLHVAELTRDALRNMGRYIAGADVVICGASYRQDVGDTRYSGSEMVVRKLTEMGAEMRVHDPYVDHWYELEKQERSRAGAFLVAILPQSGRPEPYSRAEGSGQGPERGRGSGPGRSPCALPATEAGRGGSLGNRWRSSIVSAFCPTRPLPRISSWAARSRAWAAATFSASRKRFVLANPCICAYRG